MIAKCALDFAAQGNEVTVVSDDTDVLILFNLSLEIEHGCNLF